VGDYRRCVAIYETSGLKLIIAYHIAVAAFVDGIVEFQIFMQGFFKS